MIVEVLDNSQCVHCGRKFEKLATDGYATVGEFHVCHPNSPWRPDCYHLITVYNHPIANCLRCRRRPWEPLTSVEQHDAMIATLDRLKAMIQDVSP